MKIFYPYLFCNLVAYFVSAQISFLETWNNYTLQTYSTQAGISSYTLPHSGWKIFGDNFGNAAGTTYNPNAPFHDPFMKNQPFAVYYVEQEQDTVLVTTSWIDSSKYAVDRWIVSPPINVTQPNAVFSWKARSPDPAFRDGYDLYLIPSTLTVISPTQITQTYTPVFSVSDNNVSGGGESQQWIQRSVNVSSYYFSGFRFAIHQHSKNRYQLWFDDFMLTEPTYSLNATLLYYTGSRCLEAGASDSVRVRFQNLSVVSLTHAVLGYQVNNSLPVVQTFSFSAPLYYQNTKDIAFSQPYVFSSPGTYTVKSWIQSVNQQTDQNPNDDTLVTMVYVPVQPLVRYPLLETPMDASEPSAPATMQYLLSCLPSSVVPICYHTNDSLKKPESLLWKQRFKTNVEQFVLNRSYSFRNNRFSGSVAQMCSSSTYSNVKAPLTLTFSSVQYDSASRVVQATLEISCKADLTGDFRIHVFLTENHVCGSETYTNYNGFNQQNAFYTVPGSVWFSKGNWDAAAGQYVMSPWDYKHMHVFRNALTPWNGLSGVIPGNGTSLHQTYTVSFTYTLPPVPSTASINQAENTYLTAFVEEFYQDSLNRTVWNTARAKIWNKSEIVGTQERNIVAKTYKVYPVPFSDFFVVELEDMPQQLQLISLENKTKSLLSDVVIKKISNTSYQILCKPSSVPDGIYILQADLKSGEKRFLKVICSGN